MGLGNISSVYRPISADAQANAGATIMAFGDTIFNSVCLAYARTDHPDKAGAYVRWDLNEAAASLSWLYTSPALQMPVAANNQGSLADICVVPAPRYTNVYCLRGNQVLELDVDQRYFDPHVYPPVWGGARPAFDPNVRPIPTWNNIRATFGTGKFAVHGLMMKADIEQGILGVLYEYAEAAGQTPTKYGYAVITLGNPSAQGSIAGVTGFDGQTSGVIQSEVHDLPSLAFVQKGHLQRPGGYLCYQASGPGGGPAGGWFVALDMASGSYETFGDGYDRMESTTHFNADGTPVSTNFEPPWFNAIIDPDQWAAYYTGFNNDPGDTSDYPYGPFKARMGGATVGKNVHLADLLRWAGHMSGYTNSQISISANMTGDLVYGAALTADTDLESFLSGVSKVYDFDYYNGGDVLRIVRQDVSSDDIAVSATYDVSSLIPLADDKTITTTRLPASQIATSVTVQYLDIDADFAQASQTYKRDTFPIVPPNQVSANPINYDVPIVMDAQDAATAALRAVYENTTENITNEFMTAWPGLLHEPTDVIRLNVGSYDYIVKLNEATINGDLSTSLAGMNFSKKFHGQVDSLPSGAPPSSGSTGVIHSRVLFFDVPALVPGESAVYLKSYAMVVPRATGSWNGAVAFKSIAGENYDALGPVSTVAPHMRVTGRPTDIAEPFVTDNDNVLTVAVIAGNPPTPCTPDAARNGANFALWGDNDRWEYINFSGVAPQADGTYQISGLLRGRNGTEMNCNLHQVGDILVMVDGFEGFEIDYAPSDIGKAIAVTASNYGSTSSADIDTANAILTGASQKPFAPANPQMFVDGGDATIIWDRRDRVISHFAGSGIENVPMTEATEAYDLEILKDGLVVRTVSGLTTSSFTYTAAMQAADGINPAQGVSLNIYQISALVGRGFPCSKVVYDGEQ